jgi:hypothetical protein
VTQKLWRGRANFIPEQKRQLNDDYEQLGCLKYKLLASMREKRSRFWASPEAPGR